jgi:hypothetical protein
MNERPEPRYAVPANTSEYQTPQERKGRKEEKMKEEKGNRTRRRGNIWNGGYSELKSKLKIAPFEIKEKKVYDKAP